MATSALNSTIKRSRPAAKSSESGDESSYSSRRPIPRRHRSLSRFSHGMPDPEAQVTPMRKGKFVNTVRGSGFPEISLDELAVEFFDSFSGESEISSGERGRSGEGGMAHSQRRGRSVSRVSTDGKCGSRRLDAETESSRRRRSLSRQPSTKVDPGSSNQSRRRSVSRQPRENSDGAIRGRRRSLSVVCRLNDNSESDVDQLTSFIGGNIPNDGSHRPATSDHPQSLRRSFTLNPTKHHDGYSSHSSAVTDDEGKESSSSKNGTERTIHTVYGQKKATPKRSESFGNFDYAYQRKYHDDHRATHTFQKGYATLLLESEECKRDLLAEIMLEERGRELSSNLDELLTENSFEAHEKTSPMGKRSKDRSSRMSMCLTDEAEKYIDEFISNIEDTDFSSLEDERSESSSSFGFIKTQSSLSATVLKRVPVELDGVMLPWLQWETPENASAAQACLNKTPHTPNSEPHVWESDPAQESSSGQGTMSIGAISSRGSWSPYESAKKPVDPIRRLKIDVGQYLKRPNSSDILNETWRLRHRIRSGGLVLCSRSLI